MVDEAVGRFTRRLAQEEYQNFGWPMEQVAWAEETASAAIYMSQLRKENVAKY